MCTDASMPLRATLTLTRSGPVMGGTEHRRAEDEISVVAADVRFPKKQLAGAADARFCPLIVTVVEPWLGPMEGHTLSNVGISI